MHPPVTDLAWKKEPPAGNEHWQGGGIEAGGGVPQS